MIMVWRTISHVWPRMPAAVPVAIEALVAIMAEQNKCDSEEDALAIRRIAFEVLAKLPNALPVISRKLAVLGKAEEPDQLAIRNWLFAFHQYVTRCFGGVERGTAEGREEEKHAFAAIIDNVSRVDEAQEAIFACLDTYSVLLAWSIVDEAGAATSSSGAGRAPPLIVELAETSPAPSRLLFARLLDRLLEPLCSTLSATPTDEQLSSAICMANILVMTARRLSGQSMSGQGDPTAPAPSWMSPQHQHVWQCQLAHHTMPALFPAIQGVIAHHQPDPSILDRYNKLLASCFQYMFHYAFLHKPDFQSYYENMADMAIHLLTACPVVPVPVCVEARQQCVKLLLAVFMPRQQHAASLVLMTPWRLARLRQIDADLASPQAMAVAALEQERYLLATLLVHIDAAK
ncbi:hypothetical protein SYNPS1DRAFT_29510 [Syncephalis pseudoplumigaleata]|uniref:Uncharacterized protein n=1 Tax=Syncephalis pseudoplumigaleata TaxID=1712513 RepID=A0A4P9YXT7_9FUNG|nr:hypothetical protein SYNPS1DRAFT_29510 [Syncephalis pseudoplumigaleata]|eukprot:RKP24738.1 hypothetical protein SYNPS1DRAFT_29510 [Syncephalis pseudoplumigaleata]